MTTAAGESLDTGHTFGNGTSPAKQLNAWQQPGPAAYDFRSDTHTTPTANMLNAIINTTLLDDVTLEDPTTNSLESHIAQLTCHEAALLVTSGTMGNQVALQTHLSHAQGPSYSILCDHRGHIYRYEAGAISNLGRAMVIPVTPKNGHHLTLSDIKPHCVISDDVHACPTKVISLENTLHGTIMPLSEVKAIASFARSHGIKLHLDGARIWEVAAAGIHGGLAEFTSQFDSVSLCFSKGLGAPIGSIVVGSKDFIKHARQLRKMLGGGTRQAGVISAPARVAVDETYGQGQNGEGGKLRATHERAKSIAEFWTSHGGKLTDPVETNMVWLDLQALGVEDGEYLKVLEKHGLKGYAGRIVIHYQICDDAVKKLEQVMLEVLSMRKEGAVVNGDASAKATKNQYQ
jgi:threonine aldolase